VICYRLSSTPFESGSGFELDQRSCLAKRSVWGAHLWHRAWECFEKERKKERKKNQIGWIETTKYHKPSSETL
jgi:hypothetical protein